MGMKTYMTTLFVCVFVVSWSVYLLRRLALYQQEMFKILKSNKKNVSGMMRLSLFNS
jgi:transcriptional regulator